MFAIQKAETRIRIKIDSYHLIIIFNIVSYVFWVSEVIFFFSVAIGNSISESDLLKTQTKKFFKSSIGTEPRTLERVNHTLHYWAVYSAPKLSFNPAIFCGLCYPFYLCNNFIMQCL